MNGPRPIARRRVVDARAAERLHVGSDGLLATLRRTACPGCGEVLSPTALTSVRIDWRCPPGRAPNSHRLSCGHCGERIVVHVLDDRMWFASRAELASIDERTREGERAEAVARFEGDLHGPRGRRR